MAFDTYTKRRNMLAWGTGVPLPVPGVLELSDTYHFLGMYGGTTAALTEAHTGKGAGKRKPEILTPYDVVDYDEEGILFGATCFGLH